MKEEIEHTCQFCYYEYFDGRAYPCSMCVCGEERKDMFQPKGKLSKRKDEPQTYTDEDGKVWEYRNGNWWALGKTKLQADEPNLILPSRMERGEWYQVGDTIVVMNRDDYYDLLCKGLESNSQNCSTCKFSDRYGEESICHDCSRHYSDNYEPQTEVKGSKRLLKGKDESQTDCTSCDQLGRCDRGRAVECPLTEPQTDCSWK